MEWVSYRLVLLYRPVLIHFLTWMPAYRCGPGLCSKSVSLKKTTFTSVIVSSFWPVQCSCWWFTRLPLIMMFWRVGNLFNQHKQTECCCAFYCDTELCLLYCTALSSLTWITHVLDLTYRTLKTHNFHFFVWLKKMFPGVSLIVDSVVFHYKKCLLSHIFTDLLIYCFSQCFICQTLLWQALFL